MLIYIVGWAALGLLGWGWMNFSAFRHEGPEADADPAKRKMFWVALAIGPFMIVVNWLISREQGVYYWGLRFR
ncbi:MAG TPA: hypothetical protein VD862_01930 [Candidatus Paceibacterota bacterium]|nr:hypothetical protein [Candidatus Paceibacterota bacterium]